MNFETVDSHAIAMPSEILLLWQLDDYNTTSDIFVIDDRQHAKPSQSHRTIAALRP